MTFRTELRTAVLSFGACLLASQAHALAITDATILRPAGSLESSGAAALEQGKIKTATIDVLTGLFAGDAWSLLDRTNKPSIPLNGVNFALTADTRQRTGEWGMAWDGSEPPAYMDYVLVLKAGKQWGAYLFESTSLSTDTQDIGGSFGISWLNKKGKIAKLRHASIFGRLASAPTDPVDPPIDPIDPPGGPEEPPEGPEFPPGGPEEPPGGPEVPPGGPEIPPVDPTDPPLGPTVTEIPTTGSLALLVMGLGLVLMRLRQKNLEQEGYSLAQMRSITKR